MKNIKTISICAKCSDNCDIEYFDENKKFVGQRGDYVPEFFPGKHWGDFIMLEIDIETGVILNWEKPTQKQLKDSIKKIK